LRLARYGVPLSETAPAGLAAAGIEPVLLPPAPQPALTTDAPAPLTAAAPRAVEAAPERQQAPAAQQQSQHNGALPLKDSSPKEAGTFPGPASPDHTRRLGEDIDAAAPQPDKAAYDQDLKPPADHSTDTSTDTGHDLDADVRHTMARHTNCRSAPLQDNDHTAPTPDNAPAADHPRDRSRRRPPRNPPTAAITPPGTRQQTHTAQPAPARPQPHPHGGPSAPRPERQSHQAPAPLALTQVDRYYLAWHHHLQQHGTEPTPDQLSRHLANQGIHDHQGQPIKSKALARYLLRFRIYTAWAQLRDLTNGTPPLEHVLKHLNQQGITAQYRKPLTPADLTPHLTAFERRYHALNHHTGDP
ncbi:hypothetical protein ACFV5G_12315, partial [Streptomyces sp. NPDC059766]